MDTPGATMEISGDESDDETKPTKSGQSDEELLELARDQYKAADEACDKNYADALSDLQFLKGGVNQWEPEAAQARTTMKMPMITVNVLPTYLHQVTNDQRMNTPTIKVHPVDDKADVETAKVIQGLIRHIEYDSNADVAEDTAVNSAAAIGFGWFRLITDYCEAGSFNQDIRYARIRNALSVKIDPLSVEPDGSDMQYAFIECQMSKAEFKRKYPKANAASDAFFKNGAVGAPDWTAWVTDAAVLVCEWYCIESDDVEVVELTTIDPLTGQKKVESGFIDKLVPGDESKLPEGVTITNRRPGTRTKTMWRRITGCDILETTEIKCKWIPLFPVYGDEIDLQGEVYRAGIIRNAKGPAQMYNSCVTSAIEEITLRGKNPLIMAEGQEVGHEEELSMMNRIPLPYVLYKPTSYDGHPVPAPQRQQMAEFPSGFMNMALHAADNIKKTTGLFDASLGARGNATSGKQELAQQKEGDVANFHYMDGLLRSIRHCGRCLVDMIPHYYDTQRTVRILGEEDDAQQVTINEPNDDMNAVKRVLNDLTIGKYDITVSPGQSFTTMRQESADFFANALSASKDPAQAAVMGYLAIKNADIKDGETATKMVATLLPPPAKAVLDQENGDKNGEQEPMVPTPKGPLPMSQVPSVLQQQEMAIQQLTEALTKADADGKAADAAKQQIAAAKEQREAKNAEVNQQLEFHRVQVEETNAETARMKAETERAKAMDDADKAEAELLLVHQRQQIEARAAEQEAISGDTTAFEAWKATLESETRIKVANIMAGASDRRAQAAAQSKAAQQKQPPRP